jgi:hypothetical protein
LALFDSVERTEARRLLVPTLLLLLLIVGLSSAGRAFGLIATATTTVSLTYFDVAPAYSLRIDAGDDVIAIIMTAATGTAIALLVDWIHQRDRARTYTTAATYAQHLADRHALLAMQQALLPTRTLAIPHIDAGWHYRAGGGDDTPVGGDWLVFVHLDDRRFGDRCRRHRRPRPRSDRHHGPMPIQSARRRLRRPRPRTLAHRNRGAVIGLTDRNQFHTRTMWLADGDTLALYSDGLIERRGETLHVGIDRLRERLTEVDRDDLFGEAEAVVDDLVGARPRDDTLLLLVRYQAGSPPCG